MGIRLFKRNKKTASLVFTDRFIRFMEVSIGEQPKILRFEEHALGQGMIEDGMIQDQEALRMTLEECVDKWGIKRRDVQFLVPDLHVNLKVIQVPSDVREDELKGYVFLEIGSTIHLPFEEPVFDAKVIEAGEKENQVLLVASSSDVVNAYVHALDEVKLKPIAAEISPLALYRLYHHAGMTDKQEHILLLHFDEHLLTMSIFHEDIPVFVKPLPLESSLLNEKERDDLLVEETGYMEDAFHEVEKIMDFYTYTLHRGNARIQRLFISGDHDELSVIKTALAARIPLPIEQLSLQAFAAPDGSLIPPSFLPALGLALKEVTP